MDIKTIELAPYKAKYRVFLTFTCLAVIIGYMMVSNGWVLIDDTMRAAEFRNIFVYVIIGIAFLFSLWQSQQRKKLKLTEGFGEKLRLFTHTFGIRLWWHLVLASSASFLFVLTGRTVFLYFGVLDIVLVLFTYPAKPIFRQELEEEDIVFLE